MKKYMFVLLILAIACAFSVSAVMAADLEKYDFDGKFSLQMEKGLDFKRADAEGGYVTFTDAAKSTVVMYLNDSNIQTKYADQFYEGFESTGFEKVGTDGNIRIHEKDGLYVASELKDGFVVFVMGKDKDSAVNAVKTLEFTK